MFLLVVLTLSMIMTNLDYSVLQARGQHGDSHHPERQVVTKEDLCKTQAA